MLSSKLINFRQPGRFRPANLLIHGILLLGAITCLVPFYWMLVTSLKVDEAVFKMPPDIIPNPVNTANYQKVFELAPMTLALFNSTKIAVISTVGTLFTCSLAAYAFAKIRFRGKAAFFATFMATLMIPGQVTLIPLFILFSRIGWTDTHLPLIVPTVLINAYGVFLLKQFMEGIPNAYVEAAKLDGANHFQIYWKCILPLCKPAVVTLGLFTFLGSWNNFLGPLIFLSSEDQFTVPLIINSFRTVYYVQWGFLMAAACIAVVPILALYVFAQRFFIQGVSMSGLKG
jgi:multiple sugar transport system permease protein